MLLKSQLMPSKLSRGRYYFLTHGCSSDWELHMLKTFFLVSAYSHKGMLIKPLDVNKKIINCHQIRMPFLRYSWSNYDYIYIYIHTHICMYSCVWNEDAITSTLACKNEIINKYLKMYNEKNTVGNKKILHAFNRGMKFGDRSKCTTCTRVYILFYEFLCLIDHYVICKCTETSWVLLICLYFNFS